MHEEVVSFVILLKHEPQRYETLGNCKLQKPGFFEFDQ